MRRWHDTVSEKVEDSFLLAETANQLEKVAGFAEDVLFRGNRESIHEKEFDACLADREIDGDLWEVR